MPVVRAVREALAAAWVAVLLAIACPGVFLAFYAIFDPWMVMWWAIFAAAILLVLCLLSAGPIAREAFQARGSVPAPDAVGKAMAATWRGRTPSGFISKFPSDGPMVISTWRSAQVVFGAQVLSDGGALEAQCARAAAMLAAGTGRVAPWVFYVHYWLRVWVDAARSVVAPLLPKTQVSAVVRMRLIMGLPWLVVVSPMMLFAYVACQASRLLVSPVTYRSMRQLLGQGHESRSLIRQYFADRRLEPASLADGDSALRLAASLNTRAELDPRVASQAAGPTPGSVVTQKVGVFEAPSALAAGAAQLTHMVMVAVAILVFLGSILYAQIAVFHLPAHGDLVATGTVTKIYVRSTLDPVLYSMWVTVDTDMTEFLERHGESPETIAQWQEKEHNIGSQESVPHLGDKAQLAITHVQYERFSTLDMRRIDEASNGGAYWGGTTLLVLVVLAQCGPYWLADWLGRRDSKRWRPPSERARLRARQGAGV